MSYLKWKYANYKTFTISFVIILNNNIVDKKSI